jgi:aryl-alcohol dehydrogenase-like predicted oxidoreductase
MDVVTPRRVGKSTLTVAPLGFGGGPLGDPHVSAEACLETVKAAWAGDVRFYDTAPYYGLGRSERRLGVALAECGPRESFQVNTQIGRTLEPEPLRESSLDTFSPNGQPRTPRDRFSGHRVRFDYSEPAILAQHRDSLTRLAFPMSTPWRSTTSTTATSGPNRSTNSSASWPGPAVAAPVRWRVCAMRA